ncbi:MOSC domain-containing protein [Piscinibacter sakaiensis]|uniref:Flavodoxin reductase (Ferredoxin-NADPH reductase) family 1 n=2 Tax=Piscinibacter sakaiensis TaxID=1547922 RepID=A0A0K8P108_PISS1|nr:MOSC N-terminal beta barrel domain-containing protein [Piscinibacter sakaiensis]GAP36313.1 flavodoxin reductase (ferredoxin-NADPH reductase) family 1 [Piscinibacter sakaiensis]
MSDVAFRLKSLHVYPVKSCAGVSVDEALLIETGLEFDRAWMVVDPDGVFVTQRELPRMALVRPTLRWQDVVLRAPGMLALHLALDTVEQPLRVRVWDDEVPAFDMGPLAAQWFSDFLGRPLRLVRFDPSHKRLSSKRWTGAVDAENAFSDGYPLLVASTGSLDELNRRLAAAGQAPVTLARFRPNLVLEGLDAHAEDTLDELRFETPDGPVRLKLVKPCPRCPMPDIDPETAEVGHAVGDVLAGYRADARVDGALTFGMNAVLLEGVERALRPGLAGEASYRFD